MGDTKEEQRAESPCTREKRARINFRPLFFCALGLGFGSVLYYRLRAGGGSYFEALLFFAIVCVAYAPLSFKRFLCITLPFVLFAGMGALSMHGYFVRFAGDAPAGECLVEGTVASFSVQDGYTNVQLDDLCVAGVSAGGKLALLLEEEGVRAGDRVHLIARLERVPLPKGAPSEAFLSDVRYEASSALLVLKERSSHPFLRLNGAFYDVLHEEMPRSEADVSYALLTGNSRVMDGSLKGVVRTGGIAHIFAVSGLHIGILYGAVTLLLRPLRRLRVLPASALALCYSAVCGFTVSSLRAVIMCTALGVNGALGRKSDFLSSISLAAILVLLLWPAQIFGVGFRLSFGACLGLALFSGSFARGMKRLPAFLANYCSANFSVQLFTFPTLMNSFGYFSVWGTLINFFLIPALPVIFLTTLACALLALIIPPAAFLFLALPAGLMSALVFVLSVADVSFVLCGLSLGAAGVVWSAGCFFLSPRTRLSRLSRALLGVLLALVFATVVTLENVVFAGVRIDVGEGFALVRTPQASVLVLGSAATLYACEDLLLRTYGGGLDGAIVLHEDVVAGVNVAAFLPAERIFAREEAETGLQEAELCFGQTVALEGLTFRYEGAEKLAMWAEGRVVEFDFAGEGALGADLFVGMESAGLIFYVNRAIIYTR